jgi:hypothetical protein
MVLTVGGCLRSPPEAGSVDMTVLLGSSFRAQRSEVEESPDYGKIFIG